MIQMQTKFKQTEIGLIPEDWEVVELGGIGSVVTGTTPSSNNPEHFGNEKMFITPTDFSSYRKYAYSSNRYISNEGFLANKTRVIDSNSVVVTCIGSDMGKVVINKSEALTNQQINSITNIKNDSVDFVYYYMANIYSHLKGLATGGSTMPIINKTDFSKITFTRPPLPEQKAIAEILSSLDDKIELLEKQNKTLENIGQTLFKSWFVDFEPFQNDLVESERGMIPRGWKVGKVGDLIEVTSGKRPSYKSNEKSETHQIPLYGANGVMGYVEDFLYDEKILLIGRVGTHGQVKRLHEKSWPSDNTLVLKSKFYEYTYQILTNINYSELNRGAVQPLITQTDIKNYNLLIPKIDILEKFEKVVGENFEKIKENNLQIQTLSNLRDSLLPRLMSGKIRCL